MKKTINTNAIVFVQDSKAVVATRDDEKKYLAHELLVKNEPIYKALGGVRREGLKYFCVDFPTAKNAKALLDKSVEIKQVNGLKTSFSIAPADGSYKVNFGEGEFEAFFKSFLRPQMVELLFS